MNYFALASALARLEGELTLQRAVIKGIGLQAYANGNKTVCCCSASVLPHRAGTGDCPALPLDIPAQARAVVAIENYNQISQL